MPHGCRASCRSIFVRRSENHIVKINVSDRYGNDSDGDYRFGDYTHCVCEPHHYLNNQNVKKK
jgi:hypothetical protein